MYSSKSIVSKVDFQRPFIPALACNVDQYLNHDFNVNDCGWLRNDLSALAAAQTKAEYDLILQRLKELSPNGNIPEGTKLEDAFNMIRPKYVQTENEFVGFAEHLSQRALEMQEAAYAAEREKVVVSSDGGDTHSSVE